MVIALAVFGVVLRVLLRLGPMNSFVDDAFIFLRYAANGARGHGLVYNNGERLMGFTSPAFTLLLTVLGAVIGPGQLEAGLFLLELTLFVAVLTIVAALARATAWRWAAPLVVAAYFPLVDATLSGMETMLFLSCIFGAVLLLQRGHADSGLALAVLSVLVRPEGVLLVVTAALGVWCQGRGWRALVPRRSTLAALAVVAGWLVFASAYYGSPLPQSILAKSGLTQGSLARTVISPIDLVSVLSFGISSPQLLVLGEVRPLMDGAGLAVLVAVMVDLVLLWRSRSALVALPAMFVGLVGFYAVGRPVQIWSWYAVPSALLAAWSVLHLGATVAARVASRSRWTSRSGIAVLVAIAVLCAASLGVGLAKRRVSLETSVEIYHRVTEVIEARAPGAHSIMVGDIGVIGYRTNARIVDLAGLVSETPLSAGPDGLLPSLGALILEDRPDVVVLFGDPFASGVTSQGSIRRRSFTSAAEADAVRRDYEVISAPDTGRLVLARHEVVRP